MRNNWAEVMAAKPRSGGRCRVVKAAGWGGGYKRKPPTGEHKCLSRADMAKLLAKMG